MAYPKRIEKCSNPHPGIPYNKQDILDLIHRHRGNLSRVADSLGTARCVVRKRIDSDPELKEALADSRERWIDDIEESAFNRAHETADTGLQCFILKTQARHRGYEQDDTRKAAQDIATAAFEFIANKSKNPAEPTK